MKSQKFFVNLPTLLHKCLRLRWPIGAGVHQHGVKTLQMGSLGRGRPTTSAPEVVTLVFF